MSLNILLCLFNSVPKQMEYHIVCHVTCYISFGSTDNKFMNFISQWNFILNYSSFQFFKVLQNEVFEIRLSLL